MPYKYSLQHYNKENMAKAVGVSLPISTKQSIEVCRVLRHKTTAKAKILLQRVIEKKQAIPFKKFHGNRGHKRKIGPGRYTVKVAQEIIKLLEAVEANAQFKGLNTSNLVINHIKANLASRPWHFGRKRRRKMKRTTIEVVVVEQSQEKNEKKESKSKKDQK